MADTDLCTLDDVKQYYGYLGSVSEDDDFIESLIERVTYDFNNYCGRSSFIADNFVDYLDGNGSQYMYVKNTPINTVASIYEDPDWIWSAATEIPSIDYLVRPTVILYKDIWQKGLSNYKVSYNGGYTEVPPDLKEVTIQEIVRKFKHRQDFDVLQKSFPEGSANFSMPVYLPSTFRVLSRYRRMVAI